MNLGPQERPLWSKQDLPNELRILPATGLLPNE